MIFLIASLSKVMSGSLAMLHRSPPGGYHPKIASPPDLP
jgi:hypothetical protein